MEKEIATRKVKFAEIRMAHSDNVERMMNSVLKERISSVKEHQEQKVQHNAMIINMENSFQYQKQCKKDFVQTARTQGK